MRERIAGKFYWDEASCHDGTPVPEAFRINATRWVTEVGMPIRNIVNVPMVPISWYRTPSHNKAVKGAPDSTHLDATGVDVRFLGMTVAEAYQKILAAYHAGDLPSLGGIGDYPVSNWIHLDTRISKPGHLRTWHGKGFGSEQ